jgi:hypothetical protein
MSNIIQMVKNIVQDRIKVRAARGGEDDPPIIISIPKPIIKAAQLNVGEYLRIYTDGKKICMEREPEPDI